MLLKSNPGSVDQIFDLSFLPQVTEPLLSGLPAVEDPAEDVAHDKEQQ